MGSSRKNFYNVYLFLNGYRVNLSTLKHHGFKFRAPLCDNCCLLKCVRYWLRLRNENCLISKVVYKAEVSTTDNTETKLYIGIKSNQFKQRFNNHAQSFRDQKYSNETELSNYIWDLKLKGREPVINWSILKRARAYESGGKRCNLCIEKKLCIMKADKTRLLNKRSEIFTKMRSPE